MLGAIGGTMGLCIGFSFLDFTRTLLSFFAQSIGYIKRQNKKDGFTIAETILVKETNRPNLQSNVVRNTLTPDEMTANSEKLADRVRQLDNSFKELEKIVVESLKKIKKFEEDNDLKQ